MLARTPFQVDCHYTMISFNLLDETKKAGFRWVGDVHAESSIPVVSKITPVPGGVGPMTVAMLLHNTVRSSQKAYSRQAYKLSVSNFSLKTLF